MARLLTEHDRGRPVVVGIVGGRVIEGLVGSAGDDMVHIEAETSDAELVSRVRQDSIAYVTFLIPKPVGSGEEVVPLQRYGTGGFRRVDTVQQGT